MPNSVWSDEVTQLCTEAQTPRNVTLTIGATTHTIRRPFPSPEDWRDQWIYFLMVDRFNNPQNAPRNLPFDAPFGQFQGGNFEGIRQQLPYLKELGAGAVWLSPVIKNCIYEDGTFHGYGFQDFLRVDPRFCSNPQAARMNPAIAEQELARLVDEAHALGLYVIFDVVLNHAGNVFEYDGHGSTADFRSTPYAIHWHDENGNAAFTTLQGLPNLSLDAGVWPVELQRNELFRRQGKGGEEGGDFESLKELVTAFTDGAEFGPAQPVRKALIRAYQFLIAKFDVDGFRIDTLKFIERDFARTFGNAMREFALSIGKKNFFTYGEVFDDERKIAQFIGRDAGESEDPIGVDAALDFPLFFRLPSVVKGFAAPSGLVALYRERRQVQRTLITSHGDASSHFVTFLDNHDMKERFYFSDGSGRFDDQATLGFGLLFTLLGIPCLYYGTEQGLHGRGNSDSAVREALWGKLNAFDRNHPFYQAIRSLAALRQQQPALRYGRLYFRPISGNTRDFGVSPFRNGVVAFSRLLNDQEVTVIANTSLDSGFSGEVIVDAFLNKENAPCNLVFSNIPNPQQPGRVRTRGAGTVRIEEAEGGVSTGPARTVRVDLRPAELHVLRNA